jgi:acylphosphatase
VSLASLRFIVKGRVQGVGYRYFVRRNAESLGITGFARNLDDGSVEVVAEGDGEALKRLEAELRQGPSFAQIESVESAPITARGDQGFHIR